MATRSIEITKGLGCLRVHDFDSDREIEIEITELPYEELRVFLNYEDLKSLKKHIDYLVDKDEKKTNG